ncbi:MAG: PIN domain-containing protein [Bacteroidia bacterium]|jgi:predicted nucleic acid-binding protein|nr:PIN domain-containing protein [Bacteroidia bacterium]
MSIVLDTNVLVYLLRNKEPQVTFIKSLLQNEEELLISIVTKAELLSIAIQNNWAEKKLSDLEKLLDKLLVVPVSAMDIVKRYAEIDAFSQGKLAGHPMPSKYTSRNMGKNDLWIAATASITGSQLITSDADFDHLSDGGFITRLMRFK